MLRVLFDFVADTWSLVRITGKQEGTELLLVCRRTGSYRTGHSKVRIADHKQPAPLASENSVAGRTLARSESI
jgi:hypothetical protein